MAESHEYEYQGIEIGYKSGDLAFTPNYWNAAPNVGEIGLAGTEITKWDDTDLSLGNLNFGIACLDGGTTEGYIMYSVESVHTRFSGNAPNGDNADHLIMVRYNSGWYYDNNAAFFSFNAISTDLLVGKAQQGIIYVGDFEGMYEQALEIHTPNIEVRKNEYNENWVSPGFENSWVNYSSTFNQAGFMIDGYGVVHLRGLVKSGSGIPTDIFSLPSGYRPAFQHLFPVASNNLFGQVLVNTDGDVNAHTGNVGWFCLDNLTFEPV